MHKKASSLAPPFGWRLASLVLVLALSACGGGSGGTAPATGSGSGGQPVAATPDNTGTPPATPATPAPDDAKPVIRCAP